MPLRFFGNEYIDLTTDNLARNSTCTVVMFWQRSDSTSGSERLFDISVGTGSGSRIEITTISGKSVRCGGRASDSDSFHSAQTGNIISANVWCHIACIMDYANDEIHIYKDGVLEASDLSAGFDQGITSDTDPMFGAIAAEANGVGPELTGRMDDVRVYNSCSNAVKLIQDVYNANGGDRDYEAIARWHCLEGYEGQTATGADTVISANSKNFGTPVSDPEYQDSILTFRR